MNIINVDFTKKIRKIKPLHAVNGGPLQGYCQNKNFAHIFKEANIPYARYHDIEMPAGSGQFVDIHCIFPDFEADEHDEKSYNFRCTDSFVKATVEAGAEPFYRLGESIDHSGNHFYINPPLDFKKWAVVCEHIIRHYNEGWANGFYYGIEYWEIWNEPEGVPADDNYPMWTGTKEQFFELYKITANHLKNCFGDSIKVGGYSAISLAGASERTKDQYDVFPNGKASMKKYFFEFFVDFLDYITSDENKAPLDFFTFHKYFVNILSVYDYMDMVVVVKKIMEKYNLGDVELNCAEWNYKAPDDAASAEAAAGVSAAILCGQDIPVDMMMYYSLNSSTIDYYNGVFGRNGKVNKPFYALSTFGKLYAMGTQAYADNDSEFLFTVAATGNDKKDGIIITNLGCQKDLKILYKSDKQYFKYTAYSIDEVNDMTKITSQGYPRSAGDIYVISEKHSIMYIEFEEI